MNDCLVKYFFLCFSLWIFENKKQFSQSPWIIIIFISFFCFFLISWYCTLPKKKANSKTESNFLFNRCLYFKVWAQCFSEEKNYSYHFDLTQSFNKITGSTADNNRCRMTLFPLCAQMSYGTNMAFGSTWGLDFHNTMTAFYSWSFCCLFDMTSMILFSVNPVLTTYLSCNCQTFTNRQNIRWLYITVWNKVWILCYVVSKLILIRSTQFLLFDMRFFCAVELFLICHCYGCQGHFHVVCQKHVVLDSCGLFLEGFLKVLVSLLCLFEKPHF